MQPSFKDQFTTDATHSLPIPKPAPHRHHRTKGDDPAMSRSSLKGKPRAQFLLHIPPHEYLLPGGEPINATIVELIVLLPQWFRNPGVAWRFLNNGINAAVHFAILEQHRHLNLTNAEEAERTRDHISDTYRKTMRKIKQGWTKAKHEIPDDWDALNISIINYTPEAANKIDYIMPPSVPFKDLAVGLKKLPQYYDAGDLTRALDFAMQNQKLDEHAQTKEFMFPDDIQLILSYIGHTQITQGHVDGAVLGRYFQVLRTADGVRRKQISEQRRQQQTADERSYDGMLPTDMGALMPTTLRYSPMKQNSFQEAPQGFSYGQLQDIGYSGTTISAVGHSSPIRPHLTRSNSQEAAATVASELVAQGAQQAYVDFPDIQDICKFETDDQGSYPFSESWSHLDSQRARENIDALMAAHQTHDLRGLPNPVSYPSQTLYPYHPSTLLRDCPEGLDANNHSDLARASRWARQWEYFSNGFQIRDIDLVLSVMDMPKATIEPGGQ
jgi:hypothetical protein